MGDAPEMAPQTTSNAGGGGNDFDNLEERHQLLQPPSHLTQVTHPQSTSPSHSSSRKSSKKKSHRKRRQGSVSQSVADSKYSTNSPSGDFETECTGRTGIMATVLHQTGTSLDEDLATFEKSSSTVNDEIVPLTDSKSPAAMELTILEASPIDSADIPTVLVQPPSSTPSITASKDEQILEALREVVRNCSVQDPDKRTSAAEVHAMLSKLL